MSQRNDRYVSNDASSLPQNTAEFRAAPDASASTAQFKAFAARQPEGIGQPADTGSWPEQPWAGEPQSRGGSGRTVGFVVGGIVVLAIVVLALVLAVG
jgi:hypothetical protein